MPKPKLPAAQQSPARKEQLAELLRLERGFTVPSLSEAIRLLEMRGLVDRSIDAVDGRRWRVVVTQRGRNLLEKATPLVQTTAVQAAVSRGHGAAS